MNLWVRSQDKEKLLKCNDIAISYNVINERESIKFKGYKIVGYFDKNTEYEILGTYETKERAIEILDEIQMLLQPTIKYEPIVQEEYNPAYTYKHFVKVNDNIEIKELSTFVYQMPEK